MNVDLDQEYLENSSVEKYSKSLDTGINNPLTVIKYSKHGSYIAAGCASGQVLLIDSMSYEIIFSGFKHVRPITSVVFSKCGKKLYSACNVSATGYNNIVEWSIDDCFKPRIIKPCCFSWNI